MATFYIKTTGGLLRIAGDITAQSIVNALGYVPADADDIFGLEWNSEKTEFTISDKNGNALGTFSTDAFITDAIEASEASITTLDAGTITTDSLTSGAINGTTITASAGFSGNLTGNVTGNVKGDLDGNAKTAISAVTATNLSTNPVLAGTNDNQITVTAGNKTSAAFTVPYAAAAGSATTAGSADTAGSLSTTPELKASGNNITVTAGGKTSDEFTVPYATSAGSATTATTATNLASAPGLTADGNTVKVTAGGQTSAAFTVPYATNAGSATTATTVTDVISNESGIVADATKPTTGNAVYKFVNNFMGASIAAKDAMIFKGTLGTGGTITALPATHNCGWTYKVITAGTYAGVKCEIGDLVICITDGTAANNAHWTVAQTNIDGAVIGPAQNEVTDGVIAVFDGASGKLIKGSNKTIDDFASSTHIHNFSGSAGTTTSISGTQTVASSTHTHGYTPAGSVTLSGSLSDGVLTITAAFSGSAGTTTSISGTQSVASSTHTHGYTPAGTISQQHNNSHYPGQ